MKGSARHLSPVYCMKKCLISAGHPTQIEDPVGRFHPLQIDHDHPGAVAEEDIGGRYIPVDEDPVVLPHKGLLPPPLLHSVEFLRLIPADVSPVFQLIHDPVEVSAVPVDVHPLDRGGPIVEGGKKIGERGKLFKKGLPCPFPDRLRG